MPRLTALAVLPIAAALATGEPVAQSMRPSERSPFWFFGPTVELDVEEQQSITQGQAVVKILDAEDQRLAIFAGGSLETTPETFIANVRNIVALRKGKYVVASARFGSPPQLSDLSRLTLGQSDLQDLEACEPRDCGLKLGAEETVRLQQAVAAPGTTRKQAAGREFRRILLDRVKAYLAHGHAGLPASEDKEEPVHPESVAPRLLERSSLPDHAPAFADYLARSPGTKPDGVESFLYWSKEDFGEKPMITVSHVNILRGAGRPDLPAVIVASEQIFASHYTNGALAVAALQYDSASRPPARLATSTCHRSTSWTGFSAGQSSKAESRTKPPRSSSNS